MTFYISKEKLAVQVSYSIATDTTFERKTKALVKLNSAFEINKAIIITYQDEQEIEVDGVKIDVIPIWK